jgi:hypothetical protein
VAPPLRAQGARLSFDHPKGDQSCHVEPSSRLLHPSSLALDALQRFQLTPLRTAVAVVLVLVVLALITVASATLAFTVVAFTVVQPYAVGWP